LGHRSLKSTVVYVHLTQNLLNNVHQTVDRLTADF
jgi:site-specific recombinase XerD